MEKTYIFKHIYYFIDDFTVNYYIIKSLKLSMKIIKDFTETFYLEKNEHKAKLIELLLIIGALIFAFNKLDVSHKINLYFLLFLFTSIVYFVIILKDQSETRNEFTIININMLNMLIVTMAFSYSLTLSDSLRVLLRSVISEYDFIPKTGVMSHIPLLFSIAYTFIFGLVIYSALRFKIKTEVKNKKI